MKLYAIACGNKFLGTTGNQDVIVSEKREGFNPFIFSKEEGERIIEKAGKGHLVEVVEQ